MSFLGELPQPSHGYEAVRVGALKDAKEEEKGGGLMTYV